MIGKRKAQSVKRKVKVQNFPALAGSRRSVKNGWEKFLVLSFGFTLFAFHFSLAADVKEITILYTGETHAMLYPCSCPKEPDGGISRRAALIKQMKKKYPQVLVLDSGGFFGGGLLDEYTQNTPLDQARSLVNLKAMELMQYDAATIGDDEFDFGRKFLEENIAKAKIPFLACNVKSGKFPPYIIKEINGIKIGVIGVTTLAVTAKAEGLEFEAPEAGVKKAVDELKKKGVQVIILLSHLGESDDLRLVKEVKGIDVAISGHTVNKETPVNKPGSTLFFRPSWQGRRLGKLTLQIKDNKIADFKSEELRLSDKISDSAEILAILPQCFSDNNCKKEGFSASCADPGTLNSRCVFNKAGRVNLLIVTPRSCVVCDAKEVDDFLKKQIAGLTSSYLYYPGTKADKLIKDLGIKGLPAYLLSKDIESHKGFRDLKDKLEAKGDFYLLKPQLSGISYFLGRERIKGKLELFISLYDKDMPQLLSAVKEFNPTVHFLALEQKNGFEAAKGNMEIEEYLRAVCVKKYYPEIFWDYINCRSKFIASSWWEDCLGKFDAGPIKFCARGSEGVSLLRENISLNKELEIMFGPSYLLDNVEVFATSGAPSKKELEKIIRR